MKFDYRPDFYLIINAQNNCYYFSGNGGREGAEETGPGTFRLTDPAGTTEALMEVRVETVDEGRNWRRVRTVLTNAGSVPVRVELLSASYLAGIGRSGGEPWKKHRFVLHFAHSAWTGEAQWRHTFAEDAGLYKTYNHGSQTSFRLASQSSWSTCYHEPVLIVEDTLTGLSWFTRIECGHGWCIDAGIRGYRDDTEIAVMATDCMERNDGWHVELAPGESVATANAVVGCVEGGFEEAVAELTKAARAAMAAPFPKGVPPLCYNDYMNALWALPTREKTLRLVEAAAGAGCEYYVIDAGWYGVTGNEEQDLGMWEVNDAVFGEGGYREIAGRIRAAGMLPGIWFEIESAGIESKIVREHPEYVLRRRGDPVGGRRLLLDFRQEGVRQHIMGRIRALYDMGVRYIKNDYNANTGTGIDPDGASSLHEHSEAFCRFIDAVRTEFPDLIVENCGSGAMRSDIGTLSRFHLQSVSDQEDYFRLPSIVSGSAACIPPERLGIWAYPYPVRIDYRQSFAPSPEFTARFTDGRVTAYNCVTGLMGLMYLSGRIDCADLLNRRLIKDACALYKRYRSVTASAFPLYPTGTFDIDSDSVNTFALRDPSSGTVLLAVWNNGDGRASAAVPLSKLFPGLSGDNAFAGCRISDVYPKLLGYTARLDGGAVNVSLPSGKSALFAALN